MSDSREWLDIIQRSQNTLIAFILYNHDCISLDLILSEGTKQLLAIHKAVKFHEHDDANRSFLTSPTFIEHLG